MTKKPRPTMEDKLKAAIAARLDGERIGGATESILAFDHYAGIALGALIARFDNSQTDGALLIEDICDDAISFASMMVRARSDHFAIGLGQMPPKPPRPGRNNIIKLVSQKD